VTIPKLVPKFLLKLIPNKSYMASVIFLTFGLTNNALAETTNALSEKGEITPVSSIEPSSQASVVGQHVMANMDAGSMVLSLIMVLGLIIVCALLLKRFNITHQNNEHLKLVSSLSLGPKERVVVIQAGKEQFLLGINSASNSGQITLIDKLKQTLETKESVTTKTSKLDSLYQASIKKPVTPSVGAVLSLIKNKKTDSHSNTK
jgi:flagellar biosynthetic protein FliO